MLLGLYPQERKRLPLSEGREHGFLGVAIVQDRQVTRLLEDAARRLEHVLARMDPDLGRIEYRRSALARQVRLGDEVVELARSRLHAIAKLLAQARGADALVSALGARRLGLVDVRLGGHDLRTVAIAQIAQGLSLELGADGRVVRADVGDEPRLEEGLGMAGRLISAHLEETRGLLEHRARDEGSRSMTLGFLALDAGHRMREPTQGLGDRLGILTLGNHLLLRCFGPYEPADILGLEGGHGRLGIIVRANGPGLGGLEIPDRLLPIDDHLEGHGLDATRRDLLLLG
ncbi:hypothetical protein D3C86_1025860 [compost metagenome]